MNRAEIMFGLNKIPPRFGPFGKDIKLSLFQLSSPVLTHGNAIDSAWWPVDYILIYIFFIYYKYILYIVYFQ